MNHHKSFCCKYESNGQMHLIEGLSYTQNNEIITTYHIHVKDAVSGQSKKFAISKDQYKKFKELCPEWCV